VKWLGVLWRVLKSLKKSYCMLKFSEIKNAKWQTTLIAILFLLAALPATVLSQTFTCPTPTSYKLQDATCYGSDDASIRTIFDIDYYNCQEPDVCLNPLFDNTIVLEYFLTDFADIQVQSGLWQFSVPSYIDATNLDPILGPYNVKIKCWENYGNNQTLICFYEFQIILTQPPCSIEFSEVDVNLNHCSPEFGNYSIGLAGNACINDNGKVILNGNLISSSSWGSFAPDSLPPFTYNSSTWGFKIWDLGAKPGDNLQFWASNGSWYYNSDADYTDSCSTVSNIIQIPCDVAIEELVTVDNFCHQVEVDGRVNSAYMCQYLNLFDISNWAITAYDLDGNYLNSNTINADSTFYIPNLVDTNSQIKLVWQLSENCMAEKIVTIPPYEFNVVPEADSYTICEGQTATLSNPLAGEFSTMWLDENFNELSGIAEYSVSQGGTYYLVASNLLYNCIDTASIVITSTPAITSTASESFCAGQTFTLPDGTTTDSSGTYSFQYTTSLGCDSLFTLQLTAEICTGLSTNTLNGIEIYPNPNKGIFYLNNTPQGSRIKLINSLGQELMNMATADTQTTLDLSHFATGIYTIILEADGGMVTRKLVLEK
jgi:hypothetical protein